MFSKQTQLTLKLQTQGLVYIFHPCPSPPTTIANLSLRILGRRTVKENSKRYFFSFNEISEYHNTKFKNTLFSYELIEIKPNLFC